MRVTDDLPAVGDVVACDWPDDTGTRSGAGRVTEVTADHVTVLLDVPLEPTLTASYVAFPHHSNVSGLRCRRPQP